MTTNLAEDVLLGVWQPDFVASEETEEAWKSETEALPDGWQDRVCAAADYLSVGFGSFDDWLKRTWLPSRTLDLTVISSRRKGARPPFSPPHPADSITAEHDPLRNPNLLCVLALMRFDGYDLHTEEVGDPDPELGFRRRDVVRSRPSTDKLRSVELSEVLQVNHRALTRALARIGIKPRGMRFPKNAPDRGHERQHTVTTKGLTRPEFLIALSWIVRL